MTSTAPKARYTNIQENSFKFPRKIKFKKQSGARFFSKLSAYRYVPNESTILPNFEKPQKKISSTAFVIKSRLGKSKQLIPI